MQIKMQRRRVVGVGVSRFHKNKFRENYSLELSKERRLLFHQMKLNGQKMSEIAKCYGYTRSRIDQICNSGKHLAMARMRKRVRDMQRKKYWLVD